jgi:hypothetical protein
VHKADQPDFIAELFDADVLAGKHRAQVDLASPNADAAAAGDRDGAIEEGVFQIAQALVGRGKSVYFMPMAC